jgi:large subunit ribosomal protein L17
MFRNMVTSLLKHDRIKTTEAKAKELRRWADHIVTLAKRGDLHARRQALSILREKDVVHKIFEEAEERFGSINGGYTRIVKIGRRAGDAAPLTIVEMVGADGTRPAKRKKKPKKEEVKAAPAAIQTGETKPSAAAETQTSTDEVQEASADTETRATEAEPEASETDASEEKITHADPKSDDTDK